jgi:hypothetical protein
MGLFGMIKMIRDEKKRIAAFAGTDVVLRSTYETAL